MQVVHYLGLMLKCPVIELCTQRGGTSVFVDFVDFDNNET